MKLPEAKGRFPGAMMQVFLLVVLLGAPGVAAAQALDGQQMKFWETRLELFEKRIAELNLSADMRTFYRDQAGQIIIDAGRFRMRAATREEQIRAQLGSLGPVPEQGSPAEDEALARTRQDLTTELATVSSWARRADLLITRGEQIIDTLATKSREKLKADLFHRGPSPLAMTTWLTAIPETVRLTRDSYLMAPAAWWSGLTERTAFMVQLLVMTVVLGGVGLLGRYRLLVGFRRDKGIELPSANRRLVSGLAEAVARNLMPAMVTLGLLYLAAGMGIQDERVSALGRALFRNLALLFVGLGVIKAIFALHAPQWNLIPVPTQVGRVLVLRLRLMLTVFLVFGFVMGSFQWAPPSPELRSILALAYGFLLVVPTLGLTRPALWAPPLVDEEEEPRAPNIPEGRVQAGAIFWNLISLTLLCIPMSALLGYSSLTIQMAESLVLGLMVVGVAVLARLIFRGILSGFLEGSQPVSIALRRNLAITREGATRVTFWFGLMGDTVIALTSVLVFLPTVGFGADETIDWVGRMMRGVQLGGITFSLSSIFLGIAVFAVALVLTGLVKRGLDTHILPNVTRDRGIREALKSGVGYVGFIIAALLAIGVAGIDLSNLAIIAGALSVGIGFGLQNVVNNFVSGLILLIERPIKPGDWVVVSGHEGTVKKVNVRSTEIETFQRASVIIPNADMLSSAVVNWTYKNMTGRLELPVGVDYESDVDKVKEILLEAAREHPRLSNYPEPQVLFKGFGASSLDFELRAFLINVDYWMVTLSDLRFTIFREFQKQGITIPYNQMVMHIQHDQINPLADRDTDPTP